jgi:DNA-directed RNA polymerase subunit RPC12/RpoP
MITNVKEEDIKCGKCRNEFKSHYSTRSGWARIGESVQEDRYSTSVYYQCHDCGAIWEELDEMDPGNHLHHLTRITIGSSYQLRSRT